MTPSQDLFMELHIMPLEDQFKFRILTTVIKVLNECTPPYIMNMFSIMSDKNRMNTRSCTCKDMRIPKVRLDLTKQGLHYQGACLHNIINKTNNLNGMSVHNFKKFFINFFFNS